VNQTKVSCTITSSSDEHGDDIDANAARHEQEQRLQEEQELDTAADTNQVF
jgi:hypothetical protein